MTPMTIDDWSAFQGASPMPGHKVPMCGEIMVHLPELITDALIILGSDGGSREEKIFASVSWNGPEGYVEYQREMKDEREARIFADILENLDVIMPEQLPVLGMRCITGG